jgi:hypothetical protein
MVKRFTVPRSSNSAQLPIVPRFAIPHPASRDRAMVKGSRSRARAERVEIPRSTSRVRARHEHDRVSRQAGGSQTPRPLVASTACSPAA